MRIGRIVHELTDPDRIETLQEQVSSRRFPISLFYPAAPEGSSGQQATVLSLFQPVEEQAMTLLQRVGLQQENLQNFEIPFEKEALPAPADQPSPVVLFSPGFGVDRDFYVQQISAWVEAGFLVVTIGATYDTIFTVFPDGEVISQSQRVSTQDFEDFASLRELVCVRTEDVRFCLDQVALWNADQDHPLQGRFDLNRIAVIGHSLGGAGVWEAAMRDSRVRAVVLLDASLHLPDFTERVQTPVLQVRQEAASLEELLKSSMKEKVARAMTSGQVRLFDCLQGAKSFVKICGADHMSFTTVPALFGGSEKLHRAERAIAAVVVAFLQEHLAGAPSGFYRAFLTSADKPSEVLEIDREGRAIES